MSLTLSYLAHEKANSAILITGSARSGTTILGKLVHSFQSVELDFEPPLLLSLLSVINEGSSYHWRLLYETYIYEDFLLNAIGGRRINLNRHDDSSIYGAKGEAEVAIRLAHSLRKIEAEERSVDATFAYKLPDIVPYVPSLKRLYPGTRVVVMKRNAQETISSLLLKGWFSDGNLRRNVIWPYRTDGTVPTPHWVGDAYRDKWQSMSEIDRCAYYYIRMSESESEIDGRVEVKYSDLIAKPAAVTRDLADILGLQFGGTTESIISQVQKSGSVVNGKAMADISPEFKERVIHYSRLSD